MTDYRRCLKWIGIWPCVFSWLEDKLHPQGGWWSMDLISQGMYRRLTGGMPENKKDEDSARLFDLSWSEAKRFYACLAARAGVKNLLPTVGYSLSTADKKLAELEAIPVPFALRLQVWRRLEKETVKKLRSLENLRGVEVKFQEIEDDGGLRHLKDVPRLQRVNFEGNDALTNEHLVHLRELPELRSVNLGMCYDVTAEGLEHLRHVPGLQEILWPDAWAVGAEEMAVRGQMKTLRRLDLSGGLSIASDGSFKRADGSFADAGLAKLRELTSLEDLDLSHCKQITDVGLASLSHLRALRFLSLTHCENITDQGLSNLRDFTQLESLNLMGCGKITDKGLGWLRNLKKLQKLNLWYCGRITDRGLEHLKGLTEMRCLELGQLTQVTDAGIAHLQTMTRLRDICLVQCSQVTNASLARMVNFPELHILLLAWLPHISQRGLKTLYPLKHLEYIDVRNCMNVGVSAVKKFQHQFPDAEIIQFQNPLLERIWDRVVYRLTGGRYRKKDVFQEFADTLSQDAAERIKSIEFEKK